MKRTNAAHPAPAGVPHADTPVCTRRHAYHLMPPEGWMNDPNGFTKYRGQYHLFYQHYPHAPRWDLMHWGHAVSDDLIRWQTLPIALAPSASYDADGCYSGSSIEHAGKLYVFYTGNAKDGRQTQCLAVSEDGMRFTKYAHNPVIAQPPEGIKPHQFRDPYVFRAAGRYFMIVGAETLHGQGRALVYGSDTLVEWEYLSAIAADGESLGFMWECPSLISAGDQSVLTFCPQGLAKSTRFPCTHDAGYFTGRFDPQTGVFTHGRFHKLDFGFDFYAPQCIAAPDGRLLMTAWMSNWETPVSTARCGWAGSMILPRELTISGDMLQYAPVRELQRYLQLTAAYTHIACTALPPFSASAGRVELLLETGDLTLQLFRSPDGAARTTLRYDSQARRVILDLSRSGDAPRDIRSLTLPASTAVHLDIYFDRSSVEVYTGGGRQVMTARMFPPEGADGIRCTGNAVCRHFFLWSFAAGSVSSSPHP